MKKAVAAILGLFLLVGGVTATVEGSAIPTMRSQIVAWGTSESNLHWAASWTVFSGITVGCAFIGAGAGLVTTPIGGVLVGSACDIAISG